MVIQEQVLQDLIPRWCCLKKAKLVHQQCVTYLIHVAFQKQ